MKRTLSTLLLCLLPFLLMAQVQKVAILETVDKEGNIAYAYKLMLRSNLAKAITNAPGYEAYDRTDMDAITGEQDFQRTGMVSDYKIKRLGIMTGASFVLVAEAVKVDEQNIFITAKILNVETAKTEVTDNALMGISPSDIQHGCESLASKLLGINSAVVESSTMQKETNNTNKRGTLGAPQVTQSPNGITQDGVGDLYTFSDGTKGICFYKTTDGHGLVVSLDVYSAKWENVKSKSQCNDISVLPNEKGDKILTFQQGLQNTKYIIQELGEKQAQAAAWCEQYGEGWYLPSAGELWFLFSVERINDSNNQESSEKKNLFQKISDAMSDKAGPISQALMRNGGQMLTNDWYWSSTEKDKDEALNVSSNCIISSEYKNEMLMVRAIRAF